MEKRQKRIRYLLIYLGILAVAGIVFTAAAFLGAQWQSNEERIAIVCGAFLRWIKYEFILSVVGTVAFFLIDIRKVDLRVLFPGEDEEQVARLMYNRKCNQWILAELIILMIIYLCSYYLMKGEGIPYPKAEKSFFDLVIFLLFPTAFTIEGYLRRYKVHKAREEALKTLRGLAYRRAHKRWKSGIGIPLSCAVFILGIFQPLHEEDYQRKQLFWGETTYTQEDIEELMQEGDFSDSIKWMQQAVTETEEADIQSQVMEAEE